MRPLIVLAAILLLAAPAAAQVVTNPTTVTFDHVDFATAARYDGGYFALPVTATNACDTLAAPAAAPTQVDNLGKPATTTGQAMTAPLGAKPIGCYIYKVRVLDASGLLSEWSPPSNPFARTPAAATGVAVK